MFDDPDDFFSDSDDMAQSVPYTSPRTTTDYIQLRFRLARFRAYRVVRLPLTFNFADLHAPIQYMFGWSDSRLHHAEVFPNVVLYDGDSDELVGTIKSGAPLLTRRQGNFNDVVTIEEKELALENIWPHNEANNAIDGQCSNVLIAIIYTYDLGDELECTVYVICEEGNIYHRLDTPSNLPIFKDARGAPPIEHAQWDVPGEYDAEDKMGYCEGDITPKSRKTKLEILTREEAKGRRREYLRRQKEKQARIANGEQDEDEDDSGEVKSTVNSLITDTPSGDTGSPTTNPMGYVL